MGAGSTEKDLLPNTWGYTRKGTTELRDEVEGIVVNTFNPNNSRDRSKRLSRSAGSQSETSS